MVIFLTSSFIKFETREHRVPDKAELIFENGFADRLKEHITEPSKILFVTSMPDDYEETDFRVEEFAEVFEEAEIEISEMRALDHRSSEHTKELVEWADVIFLAGGHGPTQLRFFNEIGIKEALHSFDGVLITLSTGSVNLADIVYMAPEMEEEAKDPGFLRFLPGLDLTTIQMIPHREYLRHLVLDNKRYYEDIIIPDSFGRRFYFISDGSYFLIKDGVTSFYGSGDIITNGESIPLEEGELLPFSSTPGARVWSIISSDGYDAVFTVNVHSKKCTFYQVSERVEKVLKIADYDDVCRDFSGILVENEKLVFLQQTKLSKVLEEIKEDGSFVRTVHAVTDRGTRAKNIRALALPGDDDRIILTVIDISTTLDHDWMTDELSRTGFIDKGHEFLANYNGDEELSLVYTNVRGFKAVNELFGEESGDMVIFQTRAELRKILQPILIGRLESDHFVLIVPSSRLTDSNIKKLCRQTYTHEYKEYHFDIRCGIYRIRDLSTAIPHMIDRAKLAEKSIVSGRNRHSAVYDDQVRERYVKQQVLLSEMKDALKKGEFMPYYQPVVDAVTGEIVSAEALIRWKHHSMGMVSPGDFVPAIENAGKISYLDRFMFNSIYEMTKKRCEDKNWIVPCAVNLSRIDFYDPTLMEMICEKLSLSDTLASLVRVEVTESAYADLEQNALGYLNELKRVGIKILLDDFGSGMSSLSTLENFEFDIVKLDMGFIRRIGINDKAEAIIDSTIKLSHAVGAKVTAEGVESEEQLSFLRNAGCDYIQGYYFYRPLPEADFIGLLDERK